MLSITALNAINYYGGVKLWRDFKFLEAEVSVNGLAFKLKHRPFFEHAKIRMDLNRPFSRITPIGRNETISGVLDGKSVRLEGDNGKIISERADARSYFPYGRRLFYWDDLDMAYFANYAFWNYFTLPALLMNESIEWKEIKSGVLEAIFPDFIPTHSRKQNFHFDLVSGKLLQHNYTADIISKYAKVANVVYEHDEYGGFVYPSVRRVTPISFNGLPLKTPRLINIFVHSYVLKNV